MASKVGRPAKGAGSLTSQVEAAIRAGYQTSPEIAEFIDGVPSAVTATIRRLEQRGVIEKHEAILFHPSNQRGWKWKLSTAARSRANK